MEQTEFGLSAVQGSMAQTRENVDEWDWRQTSLQASEEGRVDKIVEVELSDVRAIKSNLTRLQLLQLWFPMPYNKIEAQNWINKSADNNEVYML